MPVIIALVAGYVYGAYIEDEGLTWTKGIVVVGLGVWAYSIYKSKFKGK